MREERRKRRKRQQIITLVVCALAVAALIWGIATVVRKLTNYGNRSIASSQSDIHEDQPTDTSTADQTVEDRFAGVARNSYDAAGFYKEAYISEKWFPIKRSALAVFSDYIPRR